jgi:uncharacterized repeat protein (TIGR04052 family)
MTISKTNFLTATGFAVSALALATLSACGGGSDNSTPAATTQRVTLNFAAVNGTQAIPTTGCSNVVLNGIASRNGTAVNAKLSDLRFYVGNISLTRADGTSVAVALENSNWQGSNATDSVALLDFEDGSCTNNAGGTPGTNTQITGTVPIGNYVGVHFELGVPESLNHVNPTTTAVFPLSSNMPGMIWSWQSGRKHMKIEFSPEHATTTGSYLGGVQLIDAAGNQAVDAATSAPLANTSTFVYHLGALNCVDTGLAASAPATGVYSCGQPNQQHFHLDAFNPSTQKITLDLKSMFAGAVGTQNTNGTAAGCMSASNDPQCTPMYSMFTSVQNNMAAQTVFTAK